MQQANYTMALDGGTAEVAFQGQIDMASAPRLRVAVESAVPWADVDVAVFDLRGVQFMDSSGLSALIRLRSQHPDTEFEIWTTRGTSVTRLLSVTSMVEMFSIDEFPRSI